MKEMKIREIREMKIILFRFKKTEKLTLSALSSKMASINVELFKYILVVELKIKLFPTFSAKYQED